ncbi:hypothetical protein ACWKWU_03570 [Chitinophaga lutea]
MKKPFNFPRMAARLFTAALVLFAFAANAQQIASPADLYSATYTAGTSTNTGSTLFCAGAASFTLVSSTADQSTPPVSYTSYTWDEVALDGTTYGAIPNSSVPAGSPNKLTITDAAPGWHIYRVRADISTQGCTSDPTYFTVFVLPALTVTPRVNKADNATLTFCAETTAPTGPDAITFSAGTVAFSGTIRKPANITFRDLTVADFDKTYEWFRVDASNNATPVATTQDYTVTGNVPAGVYTFRLDVKYAAKTTCGVSATSLLSSGSTTATLTVTPKPGQPTITIE